MSVYLERIVRFVAVADHRSMTKAAAELNLDQPALSKQIHQLEVSLGFSLFERQGGRLDLTVEGREFLVPARQLAAAAKDIRFAARRLARGLTTFRLGVMAYSFWVPARAAILDDFQQNYPHVTLEVVSRPIAEMLTLLRAGELDALVLSHPPEDTETFDYLPLHRGRTGMLVPGEDSIARLDLVRMADLKGRRLAVAPAPLAPTFYAAYLDAGMEPRLIPEGRVAMSFYAERERLCVLTWDRDGPEISIPPTLVHRHLADAPSLAIYGLVRLRSDRRRLIDAFWSLAQRHSVDQNEPCQM